MRRVLFLSAIVVLGVLVVGATGTAGGRPLSTTLTPEAERPGPGHPGGSGSAALQLNPGQETVCYDVSWANINAPTGAHVHEAPEEQPGPVVVPLFGAQPAGTGSTSGCVENVDAGLIRDIMRNPEDYYVNVHDGDHPAGAIRGQLSK